MKRCRGTSLTTWVVVITIVTASWALWRVTFKRGVQGKVMACSDYFMWDMFNQEPQQYLNDDNSFSKSTSKQSQNTVTGETRDNGYSVDAGTSEQQRSGYQGVSDGSEPYLRGFDLNGIVKKFP